MVNDDKLVLNSTFEFIEKETTEGEEFASVASNPSYNWIKFILTDDLPNANKKRVPLEEFDNLIRTGFLAPIKMGVGEISEGHDGSTPIGVISNLKKLGNKILGLAAIWSEEKPDEIKLIKENHAKGIPLNLSWEIYYTDENITDDGITEMKNTTLRAATLVGMPAYKGRTQILSVASTDGKINSEDTNIKMEDELQEKIVGLEKTLADTKTEMANSLVELEELRQFKAAVVKEQEDAKKMDEIKKKFSDSSIAKEDSFFKDNKEMLLGLSSEALDFMVQELVAFASTIKTETASEHEPLPDLKGDAKDYSNPKTLGQALRMAK
jgi:hypothetical protein